MFVSEGKNIFDVIGNIYIRSERYHAFTTSVHHYTHPQPVTDLNFTPKVTNISLLFQKGMDSLGNHHQAEVA